VGQFLIRCVSRATPVLSGEYPLVVGGSPSVVGHTIRLAMLVSSLRRPAAPVYE